MSDEIKTNEGRVVGSWNGEFAQELMQELGRIRKLLATKRAARKSCLAKCLTGNSCQTIFVISTLTRFGDVIRRDLAS